MRLRIADRNPYGIFTSVDQWKLECLFILFLLKQMQFDSVHWENK